MYLRLGTGLRSFRYSSNTVDSGLSWWPIWLFDVGRNVHVLAVIVLLLLVFSIHHSAFLAQRVSSINSISALCEATDADVSEVSERSYTCSLTAASCHGAQT